MKVAIVTGSSKGIGKAVAIRLAKDGFMTVVNYSHSEAPANEVVETIKNNGGQAIAYKCDCSKLDQVKMMINDVVKQFGQIDVLVNNAGIVRDEYLLMMTQENIDACFDLNVKGYFYCTQQAALKMMRKKKGVIINMSSVSGKYALAGQTVYSATKGAVNAFTATAAKELARYGIRVNAIAPGFIKTEMLDHIPQEKMDEYLKVIPLKRLGEVEDIANVVSMLASDESSYLTGQVITLDGGLSL